MTWQTYCNNFETVINIDKSLSAIRLSLFSSMNNTNVKSIVKFIVSLLKMLKFITKNEFVFKVKNIYNIYLIESSTNANIGTLKPLLLADKKSTIILINNDVEKSNSFLDIKDKKMYINYQKGMYLKLNDVSNIIMLSIQISKKLNMSFIQIFPFVLQYFLTKNSLLSIFSKLVAKNIFLSNDMLLASNLSIHLSEKYNIQDYVLQHGFLTYFYTPVTANNYIVWGNKAKIWFEEQNIDSIILPLGTPRLDVFMEIKANVLNIKKEFYKNYGIHEDKKIFLYMSHSQAPEFGIELHKENIEGLKKVIGNSSYQLVVKLHPAESRILFDQILVNEIEKIIFLPKEENLYHSIVSSAICASAYSTTLVEAMCFDIPTLQMNLEKIKDLPDYSKKEGCISIETQESLNIILSKDSYEKELIRQKKYVKSYFCNLGDSSNAIHQYIGKNYAK